MLVPAITRKIEIENEFAKRFYSDDMYYETGSLENWIPKISSNTSRFQYAIIDSNEKLIGYLEYGIDYYASVARNFALISFDKGNPIVGETLFREMLKLINDYKLHRIEWRMIGGNPAERAYDHFVKKYNGRKFILTDAIRDKYGKYHDDVIYEIILD